MHHSFLLDLIVVFGVGLVAALAFARVRLPAVVGFLLTGIIVGPHGLKLVGEAGHVELLAEIGVAILLFTIGVEFSLSGMLRLGKIVGLGGAFQVLVTGAATYAAARGLGASHGTAIVIGGVVSLSSTAIVMRLLGDRAETNSPQGRICLGILIFQDLAVVPMMLFIPLIAGQGGGAGGAGWVLLKAFAVVLVVLVVARKIVPWLLHQVLRTRSREVFLLLLVVLCLGTAWLTSKMGLSLALGAFLAGLVVSDSEYSHHALSEMLPFRDAFVCLFFVSVGMLLDTQYLLESPLLVFGTTTAVLVGKTLLVCLTAMVLGFPLRIALLTGLFLSQVGEFSFILLDAGRRADLVPDAEHNLLLAVTVITMMVTPLIVRWAPGISATASDRLPGRSTPSALEPLRDHVIIVGYGINGQNVARVLRHVGMGYVIIELNPETVRRLRKEGERVMYGDATREDVLQHAELNHARVLVVTIPDAASGRAIVKRAKRLNPAVHTIVRTAFVQEVDELFKTGADEVVPEEFETSIEIFARVLRQYMVPRDRVDGLIRTLRSEGYEMLRGAQEKHRPVTGLRRLLADVEMEIYRVDGKSRLNGKTLSESAIPSVTNGALVLAIHREHTTTPNPPHDWVLKENDVALLLGKPESLALAAGLFRAAS